MKQAILLSLACMLGAAGTAASADLISATAPDAAPATQGGWTFSVTPYFWAAGLSGTTSQFGVPAVIDIDASFDDILQNLDFAAMMIAEARYGRYSLFGDLIYTKLSAGGETPRGRLASSIDVEASTFAGLAGGGYALVDAPNGRIDLVGGLRVWSVDTEVTFSGGLLDGASPSDGATWVDGLVGVRGNFAFTPNFYFTGWGLVGAGGADIDWDVAAGLGYTINDTFSATLGYRALGVDYSNDGFLFDVIQQGPIAGLTIRF